MKRISKVWRRTLIAVAAVVVLIAAFAYWGVSAIISRQLQARYGGRVTFSGWQLGTSSASLSRLALGETNAPDSPVWAEAERVETDLSIGGIARGRVAPKKIILFSPRITFRVGPSGEVLTRPPLKGEAGASDVPSVEVRSGRVTIKQEGRPEMVVEPVRATLSPGDGGEILNAVAESDVWGKWTATGKFASGFGSGAIALRSDAPVSIDAAKTAMLPFVPAVVWEHVRPRGPAQVAIDVTTGANPSVVTRGEFLGATLDLPTLGLIAEAATGRMTIRGAKVTIDGAKGRALGGEIAAQGTLDFGVDPPKFDIMLELKNVDVTKTPKSWQLDEAGITGRLTGTAHLRIVLTKDGADLTGSEGSAVVEDAVLSGVAVKSLKLGMKADVGDLQYEARPSPGATREPRDAGLESILAKSRPWEGGLAPELLSRCPSPFPRPLRRATGTGLELGEGSRRELVQGPLRRVKGTGTGREPPEPVPFTRLRSTFSTPLNTLVALGLVSLQAPSRTLTSSPQDKKPPPRPGGFVLPKSLATEIEFDDVDLVQIIAKARGLGIPLPFAVSGKLSLKAKATIPLGALRDVRGYAFHGRATLKGASIAGVDLGAVEAKVDLEKGVLDLSELRGQLVDRPDGSPANPPPATELSPRQGPLTRGAFRGQLHAEIAPPGKITAHFEGDALPIGEVAAPVLPNPSPLSGAVSVAVDVAADGAHLDDPKTWSVSGRLDAASVRYRDTVLSRLTTTIRLTDGRVTLPDLAATLEGHPLKARLSAAVVVPYAFEASVDAADWDLDAVLAFVPSLPRPAPVGGRLTVRVAARGTLRPQSLAVDGDGLIKSFRAGPVMLGDLPIRWRTEGNVIRATIADARPLGGSLAAEADVPTDGAGMIRGSATFKDLDVAAGAGLIPGGAVAISGRASGRGAFVVRPLPRVGESAVEGTLRLAAPDLMIHGVAAKSLEVSMAVANGSMTYEAHAETLGGKLEFSGDLPVAAGGPAPEANASLRAAGFRLEGIWKPLGLGGAVAKLEGLAAIDVNLRTHISHLDLRARGVAEVRDLRWGPHYPIGTVKGSVTVTPGGWKVEPLSGEILGGTAKGSVSAERPAVGPENLRFDLVIDRASLKHVVAFAPELAAGIDGRGTLRLAGRAADAVRADGELAVGSAKLLGMPVSELRAPAELEYAPNGGVGNLRVRRWTARFAGGRLTGDARFGLGNDHAVSTRHPAPGRRDRQRCAAVVRRPAARFGQGLGQDPWSRVPTPHTPSGIVAGSTWTSTMPRSSSSPSSASSTASWGRRAGACSRTARSTQRSRTARSTSRR